MVLHFRGSKVWPVPRVQEEIKATWDKKERKSVLITTDLDLDPLLSSPNVTLLSYVRVLPALEGRVLEPKENQEIEYVFPAALINYPHYSFLNSPFNLKCIKYVFPSGSRWYKWAPGLQGENLTCFSLCVEPSKRLIHGITPIVCREIQENQERRERTAGQESQESLVSRGKRFLFTSNHSIHKINKII